MQPIESSYHEAKLYTTNSSINVQYSERLMDISQAQKVTGIIRGRITLCLRQVIFFIEDRPTKETKKIAVDSN